MTVKVSKKMSYALKKFMSAKLKSTLIEYSIA